MSEPIRGAGQPSWPLSPQQVNVTYDASPSGSGIARGSGADWFGPLDPLKPIAPPDVAGRRFDFPVGYNLTIRPRAYEPVGFGELRGFADAYDLLRLVIETRKDQMERQRWRIRPRAAKFKRRNAVIDPDMTARIAAAQAFFHKPDGVTRWKTWLRSLLEDMFVIDAATLYCQRTRSGQLCALQQLDGSTIKRLIDDWGRTPQAYATADGTVVYPPAYQQVLKGLPAVDYAARDIVYRPRNVRAHRVYGFSPVQQVLMTVNIALRRQLWQLDYFTEGSIPDALIGVPQSWTPDQIRQFQDYWDTEFSGDLAKRRRAKFVPGESAAKVVQTKEPQHKDDFDEWLARIICYAFSVPPQWAAKVMNRATADNQSAQAEEEGLEPTKEWVKDLIDEILAEEFASPDLELHWLDEDKDDPEALFESRLKVGAVTLNEMRDALGLDPYDNAAADRPMVLTATGYVPIEANAGGEEKGADAGSAGANGQTANAVKPSAKPAFGKASADDPEHPAWPAGTPGGRGGKFRPKDDNVSDTANSSRESVRGGSEQPPHYAALENQLNDSEPVSQHIVDQSSRYAATQVTVEPGAISSNQIVNATTATLIAILGSVMDGLDRTPEMTPQLYGQLVHKQFANAVRAANIPGIGYYDVETTYDRDDPDATYGSPGSIRTDVVLHDESGKIIAIYDVKTGKAGLTPARVAELLTETRADPTTTKVIELRFGRAIEKYVLVSSAWSYVQP
jgi:Phage portal protein